MARTPLIRPTDPAPVPNGKIRRASWPWPVDPTDDYEDFAKRIQIKREALDVAVEEQAQVFLEVCERHVMTISMNAEAKDELVKTDARISRELRGQPSAVKLTEATVAAEITLHPDHVAAATRLIETKRDVDRWAALREAFDHRRGMLRELVNLYTSGYYGVSGEAGPRNVVRDALASTAKAALSEQRATRNNGK